MLDDFQKWINEVNGTLREKGVETEEINIVDEAVSNNPSITVHHYSPKKFMGLITLWETNVAYAEVLDYQSGNTIMSQHLQLQSNSDFYDVFKDYLSAISQDI